MKRLDNSRSMLPPFPKEFSDKTRIADYIRGLTSVSIHIEVSGSHNGRASRHDYEL